MIIRNHWMFQNLCTWCTCNNSRTNKESFFMKLWAL